MTVFKCKMCGGILEINEGMTVCECEYCGTMQTLPRIDNEVVSNLFNRANTLRIKSEFDKAEEIYNKIIEIDKTQAEAYWGIILCKYGIEYVEDPNTFKRVPTCHRTSFDAITVDDDYKQALNYADLSQKAIYEVEAKVIDELQKDILKIVNNEKPFDVFICYKETDENGKRTQDSVIANDIYHQLTQEGFRVFYAAITLEDKLGQEYEPYIFAALNSAKVMLVVGSKSEYFNAVWVKNEWSRFLRVMKSDRSKLLIPCYKDMDAYELPEEFSHLQAQDMSKIGFINDIVRGIKKVVSADKPQKTVIKETVVASSNNNIAPLVKRMFMFLEDGDWKNADEYSEKVLDIEPECADAYLGKLMIELNINRKEQLKESNINFNDNLNYKKAVRFANGTLKNELLEYPKLIEYNIACDAMKKANTEIEYRNVAKKFRELSGYKESKKFGKQCLENAEIARKDYIYHQAWNCIKKDNIEELNQAINQLSKIDDWKDAIERIEKCRIRIKELQKKQEDEKRIAEEYRIKAKKMKKKKQVITTISVAMVLIVISGIAVGNNIIMPNLKYNKGIELFESGLYDEAIEIFNELGDYKDSAKKIKESYAKIKESSKKLLSENEIEIVSAIDDEIIVKFGDYNWRVLEITSDSVLIITENCVEKREYNKKWEDTTWEKCTLRTYLNNDFYNKFSKSEKAIIADTNIINNDNSDYGIGGGNNTTDKIFLLSIDEINKYFTSANDTIAEYDDNSCRWWLRSPGHSNTFAVDVKSDGGINPYGYDVVNVRGVRPALNLKLK